MAKKKSVTKLKSGKKAPPTESPSPRSKIFHDAVKQISGRHTGSLTRVRGLQNAGKRVTKLRSSKRKK